MLWFLCLRYISDSLEPRLLEILQILCIINALGVQRFLNLVNNVKVLHVFYGRPFIIYRECTTYVVGIVNKVDYKYFVFSRGCSIKARKGLNDFHIVGNLFVDIHAYKPGLVKPGLKLVGHEHDPVFGAVEGNAEVLSGYVRVHVDLRELFVLTNNENLTGNALIIRMHYLFAGKFTRKSNKGINAGMFRVFFYVFVETYFISNGCRTRTCNNHCFRLAVQQVLDVLAKMLYYKLHLLCNVGRVKIHPLGKRPLCLLTAYSFPVLNLLANIKSCFIWNIAKKHIEDKALVNRLPHRIAVKGAGQIFFRCRL